MCVERGKYVLEFCCYFIWSVSQYSWYYIVWEILEAAVLQCRIIAVLCASARHHHWHAVLFGSDCSKIWAVFLTAKSPSLLLLLLLYQMCYSTMQILGSTKSVHDTKQFKSFSHSLWSCWALFPLKHSPPLFIHHSQCLFQFWKYSWNACFGILHKSASEFSLISSTDSNCRPFSMHFCLVQGVASTEAGRPASHVLWENHKSEGRNAPEHVMLERPFFSPPQIRPFSPHCLQIIFLVHHLATR